MPVPNEVLAQIEVLAQVGGESPETLKTHLQPWFYQKRWLEWLKRTTQSVAVDQFSGEHHGIFVASRKRSGKAKGNAAEYRGYVQMENGRTHNKSEIMYPDQDNPTDIIDFYHARHRITDLPEGDTDFPELAALIDTPAQATYRVDELKDLVPHALELRERRVKLLPKPHEVGDQRFRQTDKDFNGILTWAIARILDPLLAQDLIFDDDVVEVFELSPLEWALRLQNGAFILHCKQQNHVEYKAREISVVSFTPGQCQHCVDFIQGQLKPERKNVVGGHRLHLIYRHQCSLEGREPIDVYSFNEALEIARVDGAPLKILKKNKAFGVGRIANVALVNPQLVEEALRGHMCQVYGEEDGRRMYEENERSFRSQSKSAEQETANEVNAPENESGESTQEPVSDDPEKRMLEKAEILEAYHGLLIVKSDENADFFDAQQRNVLAYGNSVDEAIFDAIRDRYTRKELHCTLVAVDPVGEREDLEKIADKLENFGCIVNVVTLDVLFKDTTIKSLWRSLNEDPERKKLLLLRFALARPLAQSFLRDVPA